MDPSDTQSNRPDLNTLSLAELAQFFRESGQINRLLELARDEDLGDSGRDRTGELMFSPDAMRSVKMRSRESGTVSGIEFLADLVELFSKPGDIQWSAKIADGERVEPGTVLAEFSGNARAIVKLERTMLNLISRLSGIATRTREFVGLVENTSAKICDTRKTTPGLRAFEKYAVRCGGGATHRLGLYDAVLIKDNHLSGVDEQDIATRISEGAYKIQNDGARVWFVQVEVDTIDQLRRVLEVQCGIVDIVLLDNMTNDQLTQAVHLRNESNPGLQLEASGGVSKDTVRGVALSGVDRISIGGLTHQARSLDFGLDAC